MHTLGINIGSSNVKAVMFEGERLLWSEVARPDFLAVLVLAKRSF